MVSLNKKLMRDIKALKAQVLTIALVVSAGIAVFIGGFSTYDSLQTAKEKHYREQQFADMFVYAKRLPNCLVRRIANISGVAQIEPRLVYDVIIELPDMAEPATGRFISIPKYSLPQLNQIYLRQGHQLTPQLENKEVMINEAFAAFHHLKPGDSFNAILNGKRERLTISGIVLSPEFIYAIRAQDLLPDDKHFAVLWINYKTLATAFEMEGAYNNLVLKISKGINEKNIINKIDKLLYPYGGTGAFSSDAQLSNRFVSNELTQLEFLSLVIPIIFIMVAAFLINIVASRLVNIQRDQIATLKAIGYKNISIGLYYLKLISIIIIIGAFLGVIFGLWMGSAMTSLYQQYFHFPIYQYTLKPMVPSIAIFISAIAAISGTLGSIYYVVNLPAAEAMRPKVPPTYSKTMLDAFTFMQYLSPGVKMILRYLLRQPLRSFLTILGIAFAVAIMILGLFWRDSIYHIIQTQFIKAEREHAIVAFKDPVDISAIRELQKVKGVVAVEGFRTVPVRISHQHYSYDTGLLGFSKNSQQRQILDKQLKAHKLYAQSLLFTDELAKRLHIKVGDKVSLQVLEGKRATITHKVTGIVKDYIGLNAYMSLNTLNKYLDDGQVITGANLLIDQQYLTDLYKALKEIPKIATIRLKSALINMFNETFSQQVLVFTSFFVFFAILIAIGIVYNAARIALAERSWELASLRVLGFTRAEVFRFIIGGMIVELCIGIPLGFILGYILAYLSTFLMPSEFVRLPLYISDRTYAISLLVILLTSFITALFIRNRIKYLNLIAVLKSFD